MRVLVTGGAGFIGSHLVDRLWSKGHDVVCIDNLSLGLKRHIAHMLDCDRFHFYEMDILHHRDLESVFRRHKFEMVYHMAANSDIQQGAVNLELDLNQTFRTTFDLLRQMKAFGVKRFLLPSTSAVYGQSHEVLKESCIPSLPISFYGAAKLAAEGYTSAFCEHFDIRAWIIRFPNVVGPRATHGVVRDFIKRLKTNPHRLEVLGNGRQRKCFLFVQDLIDGIFHIIRHAGDRVNCYNLGPDSYSEISQVARIVAECMGLKNLQINYTGEDRGWIGDVPRYRYDLSKIHALGWRARHTSDESVKRAARELLEEM